MTGNNRTPGVTEDKILTVAEVKQYLKLSQSAVYALVHRDDFPVTRIGGAIRIPQKAFLLWLDSKTVIPPALKHQNQEVA